MQICSKSSKSVFYVLTDSCPPAKTPLPSGGLHSTHSVIAVSATDITHILYLSGNNTFIIIFLLIFKKYPISELYHMNLFNISSKYCIQSKQCICGAMIYISCSFLDGFTRMSLSRCI